MCDMKNTLNGLNGTNKRLETVEEKTTEFENIATEMIYNETQRGKENQKM